jgi:osmotically-inducible protein OsmY
MLGSFIATQTSETDLLRSVLVRGSAATLVAGITAGIVACNSVPPRTSLERAADAETANKVRAALIADPNIYARHIDIAVNRGVVRLGGYVWEDEDFQRARNDAASIPGVRSVLTEMELTRGGIGGSGR